MGCTHLLLWSLAVVLAVAIFIPLLEDILNLGMFKLTDDLPEEC